MIIESIVIVGAGHAGVQAAASLREEGFGGAITLLSNEPEFPYQRPPLSKAYLKGQMDLNGLPLRGEKFFDEHRIDLRLGVAAARIDRASRRVVFVHGGSEPYDHLILATGKPAPYDALPWFWSDQGDLKLQIAGLAHGVDRWVTRGDPATRAFAVFGFLKGKLAVVETVNRGGDHMAARRLLTAGTPITPEQAGDESTDLKKLALGK